MQQKQNFIMSSDATRKLRYSIESKYMYNIFIAIELKLHIKYEYRHILASDFSLIHSQNQ